MHQVGSAIIFLIVASTASAQETVRVGSVECTPGVGVDPWATSEVCKEGDLGTGSIIDESAHIETDSTVTVSADGSVKVCSKPVPLKKETCKPERSGKLRWCEPGKDCLAVDKNHKNAKPGLESLVSDYKAAVDTAKVFGEQFRQQMKLSPEAKAVYDPFGLVEPFTDPEKAVVEGLEASGEAARRFVFAPKDVLEEIARPGGAYEKALVSYLRDSARDTLLATPPAYPTPQVDPLADPLFESYSDLGTRAVTYSDTQYQASLALKEVPNVYPQPYTFSIPDPTLPGVPPIEIPRVPETRTPNVYDQYRNFQINSQAYFQNITNTLQTWARSVTQWARSLWSPPNTTEI